MSAHVALQTAIFAALRSDSALDGLLARSLITDDTANAAVYDRAPQANESEDPDNFPYVVIGEDTSIEWDTDDADGQEHTVTLHQFSRYRGRKELKQIQDAIYTILHKATLNVTGHLVVYCFYEYSETFDDPDGLTQHGVMRFRVVTQQQ